MLRRGEDKPNTWTWTTLVVLLCFLQRTLWGMPVSWCWEILADLQHPELATFKAEQIGYSTNNADNVTFIRRAYSPNTQGKFIYFHVENAVLKPISGKGDPVLTAALESLYTRLFLENLSRKEDMGIVLLYSDYKTLRVAFDPRSPEHATKILRKLRRTHEQTAAQFMQHLRERPTLLRLFEGNEELLGEPRSWHMAGVGMSPDEAATAARVARYDFHSDRPFTPLADFREARVQEPLSARVESIALLRAGVERTARRLFARENGLLDHRTEMEGVSVLSVEAIDLLRYLDGETNVSFLRHAPDLFRHRFGLRVPRGREAEFEEFLLKARQYFRSVDYFSPSIYERSEVLDMGIAGAEHGVVSFDLSGQNNRNRHASMIELERATRVPPPRGVSLAAHAVRLAREGQDRASREFEVRRGVIEDVFRELGVDGEIVMSGDDVRFIPFRPLTRDERVAILAGIARRTTPSDYRVAFLPPNYAREGTAERVPIPARARSTFLGNAELLEKALRRELESVGISYERLRNVGIGIDIIPTQERGATLNVYLSGRRDDALVEEIQRVAGRLLPGEVTIGRIDTAAWPPRTSPASPMPVPMPMPPASTAPNRR